MDKVLLTKEQADWIEELKSVTVSQEQCVVNFMEFRSTTPVKDLNLLQFTLSLNGHYNIKPTPEELLKNLYNFLLEEIDTNDYDRKIPAEYQMETFKRVLEILEINYDWIK